MQLELLRLNNHLSKGPLVESFPDGRTIKLEQNIPKYVDDKYAWVLLEKYPKLLKRHKRPITKPESPEKSLKGVSKNKMVSKYRDKADAIKRECAGS
jgi:hypothetical protein